jgi:3-dehydroquinate dehydratase-1
MAPRKPLTLGPVLLDGTPRIAVPFDDAADNRTVEDAAALGVDIAEIRIDLFASAETGHVMAQVQRFARLPTLATIRHAAEGGSWRGTEEARLALFRAVIAHVDAVDVELRATTIVGDVVAQAQSTGKLAVVSHHDFERTPLLQELLGVVDRARGLGADIVKLACAVAGPGDVRTLARVLLERSDANLVVIGMGEAGLATRVLFPALGSLFTFAHLGRATAPGQMPLKELADLLRRCYPPAATRG